jgi:hypothetical protein
MSRMADTLTKILQRVLLVAGVVALLALIAEITFSIAATTHGSTPARVVQVNAGPYPLAVSLYKDPANAGFALPFAIAPQKGVQGALQFDVNSIPARGVDAVPVHASLSPAANGVVQGTAEITVQGTWLLHINVTGPQGKAMVEVPIRAVAPPPIPLWSGWLIGAIPLYGLLGFLLLQRGKKQQGSSYSLS